MGNYFSEKPHNVIAKGNNNSQKDNSYKKNPLGTQWPVHTQTPLPEHFTEQGTLAVFGFF